MDSLESVYPIQVLNNIQTSENTGKHMLVNVFLNIRMCLNCSQGSGAPFEDFLLVYKESFIFAPLEVEDGGGVP